MDPCSNFDIAISYLNEKQLSKAQSIVSSLIQITYPPAILLCAQELLSNNQTEVNTEKLIVNLIQKYHYKPAADMYSIFCIRGLIHPSRGIEVLQLGKSIGSLSCTVTLGVLKSSINEPHGNWENDVEAFQLLSESSENEMLGKYLLGVHYIKGLGCVQDIEKGKALVDLARSVAEDLPPVEIPETSAETKAVENPVQKPDQTSSGVKTAAIIGTFLAGAGLVAVGLYSFLKSKR